MTDTFPAQSLSVLISSAVAAKMTPEFIEKEVESRVGKLIAEAVDSALRSYSDTGKMIHEVVKDALRVDRLDLPSYGAIVTSMLKAQIEATVSPLVAGRLAADMEELLKLAPKQVKLSDIAQKMIDRRREDGEAWGNVITCFVEHNEYGSAWVYLDQEKHYDRRDKYNCKYRMLVSKDGTIGAATVDNKATTDVRCIGPFYGMDQLIRAWVACGTVIELDEDYVSVSIGDF